MRVRSPSSVRKAPWSNGRGSGFKLRQVQVRVLSALRNTTCRHRLMAGPQILNLKARGQYPLAVPTTCPGRLTASDTGLSIRKSGFDSLSGCHAGVAQRIRAAVYGTACRRFESCHRCEIGLEPRFPSATCRFAGEPREDHGVGRVDRGAAIERCRRPPRVLDGAALRKESGANMATMPTAAPGSGTAARFAGLIACPGRLLRV